MLQIRVDGETFAGILGAETCGDVLVGVEPALTARLRIVTAIRINGVDEPAFREPASRARRLTGSDCVDLDTSSTRALAVDALADVVRLLPSLCAGATQLAGQLRTTDAQAPGALGQLAEGLTLLVTLVQAAETWADAAAIVKQPWLGNDVAAVAACIDALEQAQRDADWVSAADVLAYDLAPALDTWCTRLDQDLQALTLAGAEAHAAQG